MAKNHAEDILLERAEHIGKAIADMLESVDNERLEFFFDKDSRYESVKIDGKDYYRFDIEYSYSDPKENHVWNLLKRQLNSPDIKFAESEKDESGHCDPYIFIRKDFLRGKEFENDLREFNKLLRVVSGGVAFELLRDIAEEVKGEVAHLTEGLDQRQLELVFSLVAKKIGEEREPRSPHVEALENRVAPSGKVRRD